MERASPYGVAGCGDVFLDNSTLDEGCVNWEEELVAAERDVETGNHAYDSADYPTEELAMAALRALVHRAVEEGCREAAGTHCADASRD